MVHWKKISPKQLQAASRRTPQSTSECHQARNTDIQSGFHHGICNHRQQVITTVVGQTYPTSPGHPQHVACVANRSHSFGIRHFKWPIWLEPIAACPSWMQSSAVWRWGHPWLIGIPRCGHIYILALQKIITIVAIIKSQKQGLTVYLARRDCFCNISNYLC